MSRRARTLLEKLEPTVEALGYELVDLEFNSSAKHGLLRIYIDSPNGVDIEDCSKVSHQVSGVLDVEDLIKDEYNLEISSPGLDRILRKVEHFERFAGESIAVRLKRPQDGRRKFSGVLNATKGDQIVMTVDSKVWTFELDDIEKARLVPNFND